MLRNKFIKTFVLKTPVESKFFKVFIPFYPVTQLFTDLQLPKNITPNIVVKSKSQGIISDVGFNLVNLPENDEIEIFSKLKGGSSTSSKKVSKKHKVGVNEARKVEVSDDSDEDDEDDSDEGQDSDEDDSYYGEDSDSSFEEYSDEEKVSDVDMIQKLLMAVQSLSNDVIPKIRDFTFNDLKNNNDQKKLEKEEKSLEKVKTILKIVSEHFQHPQALLDDKKQFKEYPDRVFCIRVNRFFDSLNDEQELKEFSLSDIKDILEIQIENEMPDIFATYAFQHSMTLESDDEDEEIDPLDEELYEIDEDEEEKKMDYTQLKTRTIESLKSLFNNLANFKTSHKISKELSKPAVWVAALCVENLLNGLATILSNSSHSNPNNSSFKIDSENERIIYIFLYRKTKALVENMQKSQKEDSYLVVIKNEIEDMLYQIKPEISNVDKLIEQYNNFKKDLYSKNNVVLSDEESNDEDQMSDHSDDAEDTDEKRKILKVVRNKK